MLETDSPSTVGSDDRPTVLAVDDDRDLAETYKLWLCEEYEVRIANGGSAALEHYGPDVDVVLLDRRMPSMSGDEVLRRLRDRDPTARVAMVTAVEPEMSVVEMSFDDYLVKPVDRGAVQNTVDDLLALREFDEQVQEYYSMCSTLAVLEAARESSSSPPPAELVELRDRVADYRETIEMRADELHELETFDGLSLASEGMY
ncbi:response regulator [Haloarchaeobius sp. TZWWS8]|uniref:response regulator n=1 Tax=Haloarchaeobius sp. TZWWS8 TaxID=3446121 RepID=UPI003EBA6039